MATVCLMAHVIAAMALLATAVTSNVQQVITGLYAQATRMAFAYKRLDDVFAMTVTLALTAASLLSTPARQVCVCVCVCAVHTHAHMRANTAVSCLVDVIVL